MKIQDTLYANRDNFVLFISDTKGDIFVFSDNPQDLEKCWNQTKNYRTAEGHEITTPEDLLARLDFGMYEDNEPKVAYHGNYHTTYDALDAIKYLAEHSHPSSEWQEAAMWNAVQSVLNSEKGLTRRQLIELIETAQKA
jgi:hypothetical protein